MDELPDNVTTLRLREAPPRTAFGGIEDEHLRGDVVALRAEDVVKQAVAAHSHAVVAVVRVLETGVEGAGEQARRGARRALVHGQDRYCRHQHTRPDHSS